MLTSNRRRLAAVAMVLLVPALSACGFNYQTDQVYQPGVGVNNREGTVDVLGAVVVSSVDGSGTFVASLVNKDDENDDTLVSASGQDLQVQVATPIKIPAGSLVNLETSGAVSVDGETVKAGKFARVKLTFESGQTTTVNAPVVPYAEEFSDVRLASPKTPTPAP